MREVGKRGAFGGLVHLIVADFIVQARPADLEELGSLRSIFSSLLERLKNPLTFHLTGGRARNGAEIVLCRSDPIAAMSLQLSSGPVVVTTARSR